jgi:omega-6 fatty acid desaturase (delta-12 desaturase)
VEKAQRHAWADPHVEGARPGPDDATRVIERLAPSAARGGRTLLSTVLPLLGALTLATALHERAPAVALLVATLAGAFIVRLFLVLHECAHGALFASARLNRRVGTACGVLTLTPFSSWRRRHLLHHAHSSNLDRRGWWDLPLLTLAEYVTLSRPRRWAYRVVRFPPVLLGPLPTIFFVIGQRLSPPGASRRERTDVHLTTAASTLIVSAYGLRYGLDAVLIVLLTASACGSSIGFYLFHVQHHHPTGWWQRRSGWSFDEAAWRGSIFLTLPRPLRWLTCCIGYHHVHHRVPGVPWYRLRALHETVTEPIVKVNLWTSRRCFTANLWDEERQLFVGFRQASWAGSSGH